jgi:pimeloyl-ACP methyl ester carboxylesterase
MPNEGNPEFGAWRDAIAREIRELSEGAVLVGHSIGGTILVHTVARQPRLLTGVTAVCLIAAPFVGDGGWTSDELAPAVDWAAPLSNTEIYLYQGDADETTPMTHLDLYAKAIPHARIRVFPGRDHQLDNDPRSVADDIRLNG